MDYQLIDVFKKAIPPLQEIERNCDELQRIQSQINQLSSDTVNKARKWPYYVIAFIVYGLIADVIFISPIGQFIKPFIEENEDNKAAGPILFAVSMIIIAVLGTLLYFVIGKTGYKKRLAAHENMVNRKIAELREASIHYSNEISRINNENQNLFMSIPPDYRVAWKVSHICSILENQRADTLKEALNVFEEDMHRQAMQAGQRQIVNQQMQLEQRIRYAEEIAYQAQHTAEQAYYRN
jgi:hypothetical protein